MDADRAVLLTWERPSSHPLQVRDVIKAHEGSSLGMLRGAGSEYKRAWTTGFVPTNHFSAVAKQWFTLPRTGTLGSTDRGARQEDPNGPEARAARRPISRVLDALRDRKECQELELGRTRTASRGGVTQSGGAQYEGQVALVTKGVKRKRTAAATKREQRTMQTTEALAWDSPEQPACRPLLTQDGESPPEAYEPADPMEVG